VTYPTWSDELLDELAGSPQKVSDVFSHFYHHPQIGMLCSKKWLINRHMTKDLNYQHIKEVCDRTRLSTNGTMFNGGTIFWIRMPILIQAFTNINLDQEYGLCPVGKPDEPSVAHAWERIYGLIVNHCGYYIQGI
jgi:lipopolysaccharide biosynthesis protein